MNVVITLLISITTFRRRLTFFQITFLTFNLNVRSILRNILSVSQDIVMDLNNVMVVVDDNDDDDSNYMELAKIFVSHKVTSNCGLRYDI